MLQCGENGQAQTYQSRASLLKNNDSPKETRLQFDLCQVRYSNHDITSLLTAGSSVRL